MSAEKQRLYDEIDTLPEELTMQVVDFIGYLKLMHFDGAAPDSVIIKNKADLKAKLQEGLDDIKNNRVCSLEEVFDAIDNI